MNFKENEVVVTADQPIKHGMITGKIPAGIRVVHIPTGKSVYCDSEQSLHKNKIIALNQLWEQVKDLPTYDDLLNKIESLQNDVLAKRIVELNNERDALAAQVEQLRVALSATMQPHMDYIPQLNKTAKQVLEATPAQCLAEVKAQAVEDVIQYADDNAKNDFDWMKLIQAGCDKLHQQAKGE